MPLIALDCHVHIWDRTRGETFIAEKEFPQLTGASFMPEDLAPVLRDTQAAQAVLVHGPASLSHSEYCLELCAQHDMFRSVVGWVDLRGAAPVAQIERYGQDLHFRGIRFTPMLDDDPLGYLRSPAAREVARYLAQQGLVLEVLAPIPLLAAVAELARAEPDLDLVVAHFGLPTGRENEDEEWQRAMAKIAQNPRTRVKISGLPLAGICEDDRQMARRYVEHLWREFGAHRLMYASNWPVSTALAPSVYWRNLLERTLREMEVSVQDRHRIYAENAKSIY